jgi:hypothetical protein
MEPPSFVKNFVPYLKPKCEDTAVVLSFFSPCKYKTILKNLETVINDLRFSSIPVYLIELVYEEEKSLSIKPNLVLNTNSYMFHKENLFNCIEKYIPEKYSKLIFLDSDIRFSSREWLDESSKELENKDVIQPMEWCMWSDKHAKISVALQVCRGGNISLEYCHPGFAVGVKREWFKKVGGFFEEAVLGTGDACFWHSIDLSLNKRGLPEDNISKYFKKYNLKNYINKIKKNTPKVGYTKRCFAGHLPHGGKIDRQYEDRINYVDKIEIIKNKFGIYEWVDKENNKKMYEYFLKRKDDG